MSQALWKLFLLTMVVSLVVACAPAAVPTAIPAPTKAPVVAPAVAPTATVASVATPKPVAPTATPVPKIKRGGVVKFANATEPSPTLDPHHSMSPGRAFELLYGNFTKYVRDDKTGKWSVQPWYAESWEQPNPKTLVMKLKKGIRFQDGSGFNAEVAKWNLDRMLTHKLSSAKQDIGVIEKVDVVDEYTIRLNLKAPPAGLLPVLSDSAARGWIVSRAHWEKVGDQVAGRNPMGSGPMVFVHWKDGDNITLKKWDQYWEMGEDGKPLPYLDGIEYRIVPDLTVKLLHLRAGAIDASDDISSKDVASIQADPRFEVLLADWRTSCHYFIFNTTKTPWKNNAKLRHAVLYAIDRQAIANTLGFGLGKQAYYHWGVADIGYDESLPKHDYQPEKAKQLLQEAGFPAGLDVDLMHRTDAQNPNAAEMLQAIWKRLNIRSVLTPIERTAYEKALMVPNFDVGVSPKNLGELDPSYIEYRFRSGEIKNYAHYDNPELDKCLDEGRLAADEKARGEAYRRCQRIIFEDAAFGVIWQWPMNNVYSKQIKGWTPSWRNEPNWTRVWLDR